MKKRRSTLVIKENLIKCNSCLSTQILSKTMKESQFVRIARVKAASRIELRQIMTKSGRQANLNQNLTRITKKKSKSKSQSQSPLRTKSRTLARRIN